jgi:23S rRNA pseudouridine1911/1915/1917 synthase
VTEGEAGQTLQEVLTGPMGISRRMLQRLTRTRGLTLDGRAAFLGRKLKAGETIAVRVAEREQPTLLATAMEVSVLFADEDLLVVDKPPGMLTHPTEPSHSGTLAHGVAHLLAREGVEAKVRPVHRIDRGASGLVVFAKSAYAHQHLDRQLRAGQLTREYLAVTEGRVGAEQGSIDAPIGRARRDPSLREVRSDGEKALTEYRVVEQFGEASLLEVTLKTGRTHQIRVHLSHLGHPLAGDGKYGAHTRAGEHGRIALHSHRVSLLQPRTGERLTIVSPMPSDLVRLIERLRASV